MAEVISSKPGEDRPVGGSDPGRLTVLHALREYKREAQDARRSRMKQNQENRQAYMGMQDWSHKQKGQSKEFLPKTPVAVEQFVSFAKRALTQFGAYYEVSLGADSRSPLSGDAIRRLIDCHLEKLLIEDNVLSTFPILITNALKVGSLESLIVLKIHGGMTHGRNFTVEPGEPLIGEDGSIQRGDPNLVAKELDYWRLRIDLLPTENYLPDPTGAGMYEIHSSTRDLSYAVERAEQGIYDEEAVARIKEDFAKQDEDARREVEVGQDRSEAPGFRKKVQIDEFWGTIVNSQGDVVHRNVFCAMANDKYLIRKPTPNPFWHQESPFVAIPLIQVPFSVWHKALFDHAVQINFAQNELYNLIIDGGIGSVWGIRQLRMDDLEDPSQVSDGVPQGVTLQVKNSLPHGAKVLENVTESVVPRDSMAVFEMLSREFAASSLSNELKMGSLPPKQVKATEVVELTQSQAVTMDGIVSDVESQLIGKTLRKAWLVILQNMEDIASSEVISAIGMRNAFALSKMSPAERFATFSNCCSFKVHGLSQVLARTRDFQKTMALLQAVSQIPILMQAFFTRYSPQRVLSYLMKLLGVNPEQMRRDEEEIARMSEELQQLPMFQQMAGGQGTTQRGSGTSAETTGEPQLPAEIASAGNPTAGLAGAGGS